MFRLLALLALAVSCVGCSAVGGPGCCDGRCGCVGGGRIWRAADESDCGCADPYAGGGRLLRYRVLRLPDVATGWSRQRLLHRMWLRSGLRLRHQLLRRWLLCRRLLRPRAPRLPDLPGLPQLQLVPSRQGSSRGYDQCGECGARMRPLQNDYDYGARAAEQLRVARVGAAAAALLSRPTAVAAANRRAPAAVPRAIIATTSTPARRSAKPRIRTTPSAAHAIS